MNRSQAILHAVHKRPGLSPRQIAAAIGEDWHLVACQMSAQLHQLCVAKKLRRTGKPRAFLYYPTDDTLRDLRTGKRMVVKPTKAKPARKKPAAKPAAPKKPRAAVKPTAAQQVQVVAKPLAPPASTPKATPFETVEQFLARGGRIQRLPDGASATPLHITRADIDDANWRRREQQIESQ